MDFLVAEDEGSLFVQSTRPDGKPDRARSFEQFDSTSTHTAANTTSVSHSSQYTPMSSTEVGPQEGELQRGSDAPLAPEMSPEGGARRHHDGQDEDEEAEKSSQRDPNGRAAATTTTTTTSASTSTSRYPGLAEQRTVLTVSHDDIISHTTTHSVPVSQTTVTSSSDVYDYTQARPGSVGRVSATAGITYKPAATGRTQEPSLARDNEEDVEEEEEGDKITADFTAHSAEEEEEDIAAEHTTSPRVSAPGVYPDSAIASSLKVGAGTNASLHHASRVTVSCTPPPADMGLSVHHSAPIANPLAAQTRVPLRQVEASFAEEGVIALLSFLCEENRMDVSEIPSSVFHSHCLPPMTVRNYVKRVVTYSQCSVEALLCSLVLLLKYSLYSQHAVTTFNVHRLFIASIVLAAKLRDDQYYSNKYYASIGGIKAREMNRLEMTFLTRLNWFISIREEEYASLLTLLESLLEVPSGAVRVPEDPSQLARFAQTHAALVSSYDLCIDIDDVNLKAPNSEEVRRLREASAEETNAWKLERAFRRHHWRAAISGWLDTLHREQLATDKKYEALQAADWLAEEERWTRIRQADRLARSSTSSDGSSRWMSPLTVNPGTGVQWPVSASVHTGASTTVSTSTPTRRAQHASHGSDTVLTVTHSGTADGASGVTTHSAAPHARFTNFPDYVQQPDAFTRSNVRYNSNHGGVGSGQRAYGHVGTSGGGGAGSGVVSIQNYAFSAAGLEQPHARRASPSSAANNNNNNSHNNSHNNNSHNNTYSSSAAAPHTTMGIFGNSSGVYGHGGLQSTAPPHQSHHSFTTWSQQRKTTSATMATATTAASSLPVRASPSSTVDSAVTSGSPATPGSRLNANAQPYSYVSSRQKRAMQQQQQQQQQTASPVSPQNVEAPPQQETARFTNWRSPTDDVPFASSASGVAGVSGQFPAMPFGQPSETSTSKATVAFSHAGLEAGSNTLGGTGGGGNSREEGWASSRRHSSGSASVSTSIAGKKRRKPQNYVDY